MLFPNIWKIFTWLTESETEERRTGDKKGKKISKVNGRRYDIPKSKGKKWKEDNMKMQ